MLSVRVHLFIPPGQTEEAVLTRTDQSLGFLARLEDETSATTVHVQEKVPVRLDIPFRRDFEIPISASVPISHRVSFHETFEILVDTLQGTQAVKVPISTTAPLRLTMPVKATVPVTISETIPIHADLEIDAKVPVAIKSADTQLLSHLEQFKTLPAEVRQQLSLGQRWPTGPERALSMQRPLVLSSCARSVAEQRPY